MHITDNAGKTKRILQYSPFGDVYKFEKTIDIERTLISFTGYDSEENLNRKWEDLLRKVVVRENLNYYMY